jgi:hypothetical protein
MSERYYNVVCGPSVELPVPGDVVQIPELPGMSLTVIEVTDRTMKVEPVRIKPAGALKQKNTWYLRHRR